VVLYDDFICDIKAGLILDDYEFELLEKQGEHVVPVQYKGIWLVVDNGYHNWSITVPPFSNLMNYDEIRWSEWLESMRKDVEVRVFDALFAVHSTHCFSHSITCLGETSSAPLAS
jgi:hypothetical protein